MKKKPKRSIENLTLFKGQKYQPGTRIPVSDYREAAERDTSDNHNLFVEKFPPDRQENLFHGDTN